MILIANLLAGVDVNPDVILNPKEITLAMPARGISTIDRGDRLYQPVSPCA
jgi:hypothetical protein